MRFLKSLFLVVLAFWLQFSIGEFWGVWINFVLATLIALAFFVNFEELLLFTLLGVLFLNWQPALSWELVIAGLFPISVFSLRRIFLWEIWLSVLIANVLGLTILYLVTDWGFIMRSPLIFLADLVASLVFASLVAKLSEAH